MKMKVKYFDGKSSKSQCIEITFSGDSIRFESLIESENYVSNISEWKRVDYNSKGDMLTLENNEFPPKKIEINTSSDIELLMAKFPEKSKGDLYQRILSINPLKLITYSFLSIIGVISIYLLFIGPLIAKQVVKMTSIETEVFIGNKLSNNIFMTLDIDEEKSSELMSFYQECNYKSQYPIEIYYSNSHEVNAFAIPGGKIVVFKGIIDKMESYEELAGLIGHELAHVEKRHSLIQISNQLSTYFLVSVITSDVSGISATILENSINFNHLKNSRDFEKEADLWGLEQMKKNSINQKGMSKLFERIMNEHDEFGASVLDLEFLSSHPLTSKRIDYINSSITDSVGYQNKKAIAIFDKIKAN